MVRNRRGLSRAALSLIGLMMLAAPAVTPAEGAGIEDSVVRIVNYSQRGDWYSPWNLSTVQESSGSGFIIEGGLVMTNAHVISDARHLLIFLHNNPQPHEAEVYLVAHDGDLALLRPRDHKLLDNVPSLSFGGLPELGSIVVSLGYPVGGTRLSSTRGIVSRIEPQVYTHSGADRHLTVQTDAAINPGNSGGPVVQDDLVVGVAFQVAPDLQSVGYFIPMEVIDRFLRDAKDDRYDGYPELGVKTSGMENAAARRKAGMEDGESGVRVDAVYPASSADGAIREGDVILEVQGRPVANDGTVADGNERFDFGMLVDRQQIGESVALRVLRDGERLMVQVLLRNLPWTKKVCNLHDVLPRYYVYGGLVFVPLDLEMLKTFGNDWYTDGDMALLHEFQVRPLSEIELTTRERVVLLRRLDHPVNANFAWYRNQVIERVNGREIDSLESLVDAIETHDGDYHFIEFANYRRFEVLGREEAERANADILEGYGITRDRNL